MNQKQPVEEIDPYYVELDSIRGDRRPSEIQRNQEDRRKRSVLRAFYDKVKDKIDDLAEETKIEQSRVFGYLLLWLFISLFVDTIRYTGRPYSMSAIVDLGLAYLGYKGLQLKNYKFLIAFGCLMLGDLVWHVGELVFSIFNKKMQFSIVTAFCVLVVSLYQLMIVYFVAKLEIVRFKVEVVSEQLPQNRRNEPDIRDDFELDSRKHSIASALPNRLFRPEEETKDNRW